MTHSLYEGHPSGRQSLIESIPALDKSYEELHKIMLAPFKTQLDDGFLTLKEASHLRAFFHTKIRDICAALEFSLHVAADAHILLHRYFTKHTLLDHDAKHIMLSCIYLATKTQNMHLNLDHFAQSIPNSSADMISDLELVVLDAVEFKIPLFSPLPCIFGMMIDFLPFAEGVQDAEAFCHNVLDRFEISITIDKIFLLYSPSEIAAACVLGTAQMSESYWEERLRKLDHVSEFFSKVQHINQMIDSRPKVSEDELREMDKKLRTLIDLKKRLAT